MNDDPTTQNQERFTLWARREAASPSFGCHPTRSTRRSEAAWGDVTYARKQAGAQRL